MGDLRHLQISGVTGWDWFVLHFMWQSFRIRHFAQRVFDLGRRSFTLPDGTCWQITERGTAVPMQKEEGL